MARIEVLPLNILITKPPAIPKRIMDIVGSIVFLILLSPLFVLIYAFIKIVSPGPVFYRQERIGHGGKPFLFWKFRTMKINADPSLHEKYVVDLIKHSDSQTGRERPMNKLGKDPRIIPFGSLLRNTCLDELPQLFNVLRGDMSLVGPRPPLPYEVREYALWHKSRLDIVPGMTGLWQVSGKNRLSFTEMLRLDLHYAEVRSLWVDFKILLKTPLAILDQIQDPH